MYLARFTETHSRDLEEVRHSTLTNAGGTFFDARTIGPQFQFHANAARSPDVSLIYVHSNAATSIDFAPVSYHRIIFQTEGRSSITVSGREIRSTPANAGYLVPAEAAWKARHPQGYGNLSIRAETDALRRKLNFLIGDSIDRPIEFRQPSDSDPKHIAILKQSLILGAIELDTVEPRLLPICIRELKDGILLRMLLYLQHNFTGRLWKPARSPGRSKLLQVEELLQEQWDQPIDMALLATIADASSRSVFRHFQSHYGCTPWQYVKRLRLDRAKDLLESDTETKSVMDVALKCGFRSFSHFTRSYAAAFGELPSETLKNRKIRSRAFGSAR